MPQRIVSNECPIKLVKKAAGIKLQSGALSRLEGEQQLLHRLDAPQKEAREPISGGRSQMQKDLLSRALHRHAKEVKAAAAGTNAAKPNLTLRFRGES